MEPTTETVEVDNNIYHGRVKIYLPKKGFGFLQCADAFRRYNRDVFLHKSQMEVLLGRSLGTGTALEKEEWSGTALLRQTQDVAKWGTCLWPMAGLDRDPRIHIDVMALAAAGVGEMRR